MYRKLINIEPDGAKKEYVLYSMKKGRDKVVGAVPLPGQRQGPRHAAPGRQHVALHSQRRKAGANHQPAVGDRRRIQQRRHPARRLHRGVQRRVDGRGERALCADLKAKTGDVAYDRLKMWVDKNCCCR